MENSELNINHDELKSILVNFGDQVDRYVFNLKQKSSDEIMTGSLQRAQLILEKIILVEKGIEKVNSAHEYLLGLINGNNGKAEQIEEIKQKKNMNPLPKNEKIKSSKNKFRMPLLKSLIYLGGTACEQDILDYLEKEMKKYLVDKDYQIAGDDKLASWVKDLITESSSMTEEKLLTIDEENKVWEITQAGIDFLSKNDE